MKRLKLFFACLLMAVLSIGQMWGKTYKLTQVTSVSAGNKYVFVQSGHAMNNTCSSSALQTTTSYNLTGLAGTETYVWTLETATGGFYLKNVSLNSNQYLNNSSSTGVSLGSKSSIWSFNFQIDGNVEIQNNSNNNRFLGFTNSTSYAYKAYATSNMNGTTYPHVIYAYVLEEETTASPSVSVSPTSLTFDAVEEGGSAPSAKTFTITGSNLTSALSVTSTNTTFYTCSVTNGSLTPTNKAVSATIRVTPQAAITGSAGTKEANITISGGGLTSNVNVALSTTVTVPAHNYTYNKEFSSTTISDWSDWGNGYTTPHTVNFDIYNGHAGNDCHVYFAGAAKQGSTISTMPVAKNAEVNLVLDDPDKYISAVKFDCQQWSNKAQTVTLKYSTDGGTTFSTLNPSVSSSFTTSTTGATMEVECLSLPPKTNAVQVSGSNSNNQIGYSAVHFDLVDKVTYNIGKSETGCTLSVTNGTSAITTAEAGDEVYVSIASTTEGYENTSFVVKDADNADVTVTNGKFTMPAMAVTITATATKKQYTVTLSATNGHITVGGNTVSQVTVNHGETATLTAVANTDYAFDGWSKSAGANITFDDASENPTTITVTGAGTVTAAFRSTAKADPELSWSSNTATAVKGQTPTLPNLTNSHNLSISYESSNTSVAEIAADGTVTINGVGEATITASNAADDTYAASSKSYTLTVKGRVTWHAKKAGVDATTYADYVRDAVPTKPTGDFIASCHSSISLVGWTTVASYSHATTAPNPLYTGNVPAVTDNVDYYAVWANASEDEWTETTLGNISSSDVVVIAGYDGEDYYGIKSAGSSSPTAIEITVEDGKITSEFDDENDNIKWNITGNAIDGYSFYVNGGTEDDRLYCSTDAETKNNTSWKVGNPTSGVNRYTLDWSSAKNTMVTKDNSTARYLCLYQGTDWRSYLVGSVTTTNLTFFKYSAGSTTNYTTNCVEPFTVATPTFDPDGSAAYYTSAQNVEISCVTENSTIYYTTNGSAPNNESTEYTGAINVSETTTIKAIAYVGNVASEIAEATFTINMPLTTIQGIFEEATAIGTSATQKRIITFGNWIVSAISTDNKSVYVTDNTKGFVIYGADHGFEVGNILSGTVECDLQLYSGFAEIKGLKANNANLTVTTGGTLVPAAVAIKNLDAVNTGAPVILSNVTYDSDGDLVDDEYYYLTPDKMLYDYGSTFELNKIYNVTGVYIYGSEKIAPRNDADIVKLSKDQQTITWYVDNTKEDAIGASYSLDSKDDDFAPVCESNSTGTKSYQSSDPEIATIDENGVITILKNGVTTITCTVAEDDDYVQGSKSFTLKVGVGEATWVATTWASDNSVNANDKMADWSPIAIDANLSMTWSKAGGSNDPIYHSDGEGRLYQKNTLTFTASNSKQITRIVFHFTGSNTGTISASEGTYSAGEWAGFVSSVTFTNAPGATGAKIKSIDIEYAQGTTTTLSIDDIVMLNTDGETAISFTSNKPSAVVTYSNYDEDVIAIADGKITPVAIGNTTVKASIAAEAPYSSVTITFNVRVKSSTETVENVVILSQFGEKWLAMKHDFTAVEVEKAADGTILDLSVNEGDITWIMTADGASAMFQQLGTNKYMAIGSSNSLTLVDEATIWTLHDDGYYYNVAGRTFLYQGNGAKYKNYATSNAGTDKDGGYSEYATFIAPVFANRTEIRDNLAGGKMGTICPKQEVKYPTGASFYELSYKTIENGMPYKVFFDEIAEGASLEAGKPYLFVADGEAITGVKVGDEAEHTAGISNNSYNGFYGILTDNYKLHVENQDDVDSYKYYIISNNEIRLCGLGDFNIPAERAYINMSALTEGEVAQAPGRRRVCLTNHAAEVATGIESIQPSEISIQKVMINGQLFILRGEKMYDVTGKVVR